MGRPTTGAAPHPLTTQNALVRTDDAVASGACRYWAPRYRYSKENNNDRQ